MQAADLELHFHEMPTLPSDIPGMIDYAAAGVGEGYLLKLLSGGAAIADWSTDHFVQYGRAEEPIAFETIGSWAALPRMSTEPLKPTLVHAVRNSC